MSAIPLILSRRPAANIGGRDANLAPIALPCGRMNVLHETTQSAGKRRGSSRALRLSAKAEAASRRTVADLLDGLGGISAARVRLQPAPGTATERDVIAVHDRENRLFELVDGALVEKVMGFDESRFAILLGAYLFHSRVVRASRADGARLGAAVESARPSIDQLGRDPDHISLDRHLPSHFDRVTGSEPDEVAVLEKEALDVHAFPQTRVALERDEKRFWGITVGRFDDLRPVELTGQFDGPVLELVGSDLIADELLIQLDGVKTFDCVIG